MNKTFSEFDLARAIFTYQNHDIICHKAEIKKDILASIGQMIHLNITNMDQEKDHYFYAYMIGTTIS